MKSVKFILLTALAYTAYACQPIIRVYDLNEDGESTDILIAVDEIDLLKKGVNKSQIFTCPEGVWMGYQWEGYAGSSYLLSGNDGGLEDCREYNDGTFRSLKVVGSPDDYTASAVVAYMGSNNELAHTTYLPSNDTENLVNPFINSIILTGNEEVEIFTETNFGGVSFCIPPNVGIVNDGLEFQNVVNDRLTGTELFTNLIDLNLIFNQTEFHSLRFGCA